MRRQPGFPGAGQDQVGAARVPGVLRAEAGVNAPQDDRDAGEICLDQGDGGGHAGVPVGHEGGDQDGVGPGQPGQAGAEVRLADPIAPETPGNIGEGRRGGDDLFGVAAGAAGAGPGVGHVQAVQEVDLGPLRPEPAGQVEQS